MTFHHHNSLDYCLNNQIKKEFHLTVPVNDIMQNITPPKWVVNICEEDSVVYIFEQPRAVNHL